MKTRGITALLVAALSWALHGCGNGSPKAETTPAEKSFGGVGITVAVLGDPTAVEVIAAQRGEWQASRGAEATVRAAKDAADARGADVIVFPGERMGDLADVKALAILPGSVVRPPVPKAEPGKESEPAPTVPNPLAFQDVLP